ncbi:MAG TPA: glutathione S-transferase family protein [Rhodanobacteraceae bacterium]|nr:glutathione S-transferase family protein [Rhodanobacteraceae bacterium]
MYTLYYAPGSANMLVHLTLLELGAPYRLERIDLDAGQQRSAEYLKLNPDGVVPTLIVDGQPHGEAAALALLLTERHPDGGLAPAPGSAQRGEFLQRMFWFANSLQPAFRQWFYPGDFSHGHDDAIKDAARAAIEAGWSRLHTHLATHGPYLLGDRFSLLDLYAIMLMRWSRNMPRPATSWPHLAAFAERIKARPSWPALCQAEGLVEWA